MDDLTTDRKQEVKIAVHSQIISCTGKPHQRRVLKNKLYVLKFLEKYI